MKRLGLILLVIGLIICGVPISFSSAAQSGDPTPPPMIERLEPSDPAPMIDRLAPPPMPENPTQADQGAYVFYLVCMVCHGDRGQGLTDEWRGTLDPEDQDCWQSRCHASNHPPEGFVFPTYVPSVTGAPMLARFNTAQDLHEYLVTKMPWQNPGMRSEEEYWQLTAFLMRLNGVDPGMETLGIGNAGDYYLNPSSRPTATPLPAQRADPSMAVWLPVWIGLGGLLILVVGIALGLRLGKGRED